MKEACPKCGSEHVDRVAVDIGVGTQYGPLMCYDCGWTESDPLADLMIDDTSDMKTERL